MFSRKLSISNKVFFAFFYFLITSSFVLKLPPPLILFVLVSMMLFHVFFFTKDFLLFPFLIYPFRFLIRVSDVDSPFLSILPEIITFLSLAFFLITIKVPRVIEHISRPVLALSAFVAISIFVFFLHGLSYDYMYFFVVLRTYILPMSFTLALIHYSMKNKQIPYLGLTYYMISTTIVAVFCLLQYFNLYKLPSDDLLFYRTLIVGGFDDRAYYESERTIASLVLPRLNLLSGGSLGSSAGFFFAIGLLWVNDIFSKRYRILRILFSVICIFSALLTLSFSVMSTLMVLTTIYLFIGNRNKKSLINPFVVRVIAVSLVLPFLLFFRINDMSILEYLTDTYSSNSAGSLPILTILFGYGIDYFSSTLVITPENNIGDIGVFKMLFQTGIFSFVLMTISFYYIIFASIKKINKGNPQLKYTFLFLMLLVLFLVHQNWMVGSPFYLLFSASVAGILSAETRIPVADNNTNTSFSK